MPRSAVLFMLVVSLLAAGLPALAAGEGRIVVETVHARALQGNAIGDDVDRRVTVYLPPGYDAAPKRRYPVLYLLHGATSDPKEWLDGSYQGMNLAQSLDRQAGEDGFIVVMPMADNRFGGSFYVNSRAFGRWEDFIARELVDYVDAQFRTLPTRASRGLAGQSMGGFGALYLGGRHPDTFGHVYAVSPCCLAFVGDLAPDGARWAREPGGWLRAMAMALDPKAGPDPAQAPPRLPYTIEPGGKVREHRDVVRRWERYMPLARLGRDARPYARLCSLGLEAGTRDEIPSVTQGAAAFSRQLSRDGIRHAYAGFDGGHVDHTRERFETALIPFFAHAFAEPEAPGTCR